MNRYSKFLVVLTVAVVMMTTMGLADHSIDDFGAISGERTHRAGIANSMAISKALLAANASSTDKTALVPKGRSYWILACINSGLDAVSLKIDGELVMSNNFSSWDTQAALSSSSHPFHERSVIFAHSHSSSSPDDSIAAMRWKMFEKFKEGSDGYASSSPAVPVLPRVRSMRGVSKMAIFDESNNDDIVDNDDISTINGNLGGSKGRREQVVGGSPPLSGILFENSTRLEITGSGVINGLGYDWWWANILGIVKHRPHMLFFSRCEQINLHGLRMIDSPMYHVRLAGVKSVWVKDVSIIVHVEKQKDALVRGGRWDLKANIPVFPLNTDGIDPSGTDVLIEDSFIQNFDDAVAVKPSNAFSAYSTCSENMLVRNVSVKNGVGMSIGSVPPHIGRNCIQNITFEDITFVDPFKAVYVKTDPGTEGTGLIADITYNRLRISGAIWYPIFIGPQQQDQPGGGTNTGCSFFYPEDPTCPTQPRVAMKNIVLNGIESVGGMTMPGVILCDPKNPCTGFVFNDVVSSGEFVMRKDYSCINAQVKSTGLTSPTVQCSNNNGQ